MLYRSKGQPMGSIFLWHAAIGVFGVSSIGLGAATRSLGASSSRVRWRGRAAVAGQYFLHDPLPTVDGVGNHAVRGDGEEAAGEQSAAGMLLAG